MRLLPCGKPRGRRHDRFVTVQMRDAPLLPLVDELLLAVGLAPSLNLKLPLRALRASLPATLLASATAWIWTRLALAVPAVASFAGSAGSSAPFELTTEEPR